MNIFLTGATGFLGSHTAEELIRLGHHVTALVRKTSDKSHLQNLPLHFVEGALPNGKSLRPALENADVIIHGAGVIKGLSEEDFFRVNAEGTQSLVDEIVSLPQKPKLFLHVSTIAVHNPTQDGNDFCQHPSDCHPLSVYGRSKNQGELALSAFNGNIKTIVLRPPVLYGPRDRELLPLFKSIRWGIAPVFRSGENQLSVCYVEDVARALADLAENPPPKDEIYCLDDGEVHTWKSLSQEVDRVMGKKPFLFKVPSPLFKAAAFCTQTFARLTRSPTVFTLEKMKEIEQPRWVCGYQKLNRQIGWKPKVSLREGLQKTLRFYEEEKWI